MKDKTMQLGRFSLALALMLVACGSEDPAAMMSSTHAAKAATHEGSGSMGFAGSGSPKLGGLGMAGSGAAGSSADAPETLEHGSAGSMAPAESGTGGAAGQAAAGASGGEVGSAGAAGMTASAGTSAPAPCPDADGDGKCDSVDPCPQDALDDSDGDGSCDSADKCPGFDDRLDADHDGIPDDCDRCPGKSDTDADGNGYPDACDTVLWSLVLAPQQTTTSIVPLRAAKAALKLHRGDDVYVQLSAPLTASVTETSLTAAGAEVQIEMGGVKSAGTFADVQQAFAKAWSNVATTASPGLLFNSMSAAADHWGSTWPPIEKTPTIATTATIVRAVVSGSCSTDGAYSFTWEIRGY